MADYFRFVFGHFSKAEPREYCVDLVPQPKVSKTSGVYVYPTAVTRERRGKMPKIRDLTEALVTNDR